MKRVTFETNVTVHVMIVWKFAYHDARIGRWESVVADRYRFKRRCLETERISHVFDREHRDSFFKKHVHLKMLLMSIIGLAIVIAVGWYIMSLLKDIHTDQASKNAINNISHWLSSQLGYQWLLVIVVLLIITFVMSSGCTINVSEKIWWMVGMTTLAVLVLLTWKWRQEYLSQNYQELGISKTQYYVEFGLIVTLLILNTGIIVFKI